MFKVQHAILYELPAYRNGLFQGFRIGALVNQPRGVSRVVHLPGAVMMSPSRGHDL